MVERIKVYNIPYLVLLTLVCSPPVTSNRPSGNSAKQCPATPNGMDSLIHSLGLLRSMYSMDILLLLLHGSPGKLGSPPPITHKNPFIVFISKFFLAVFIAGNGTHLPDVVNRKHVFVIFN